MTERNIDDLDLDNDIIASLLEKLTLETKTASLFPDEAFNNADEVFNILQSIEKTVAVNVENEIEVKPGCSHQEDKIISENCNNSSSLLQLEKDHFLSSIGLASPKLLGKQSPCGSKNSVSKTPSSAKNLLSDSDAITSCDNFTFTPFNFPKVSTEETDLKSLDFLHEVFQGKGQVFNFNLNSPSECNDDERSCSSLFLTNGDTLNDDKSLSSPDSGFHDAFHSVASPEEESLSSDNYDLDDASDEELQQILLAFAEYEFLCSSEDSTVPSLKDAKNPDEHIEKILDFLRQPVSQEDEAETLNYKEVASTSVSDKAILVLTKKSPKSKKLSCRLKYTLKNGEQLRHSPIFSKTKYALQNSKILKQIQSEHIQKRIKVIQKKLKRSAVDDRENKRQRIMYKDSSLKNEEQTCCKEEVVS